MTKKYKSTPELCKEHSQLGPNNPWVYNDIVKENDKYYWTEVCFNCGYIWKNITTQERYVSELVHNNQMLKYRNVEQHKKITHLEIEQRRLHRVVKHLTKESGSLIDYLSELPEDEIEWAERMIKLYNF